MTAWRSVFDGGRRRCFHQPGPRASPRFGIAKNATISRNRLALGAGLRFALGTGLPTSPIPRPSVSSWHLNRAPRIGMVAAVDFDSGHKPRGHRPHPAANRTCTAPRLRQSLTALGSGYGLNKRMRLGPKRKTGYAQNEIPFKQAHLRGGGYRPNHRFPTRHGSSPRQGAVA